MNYSYTRNIQVFPTGSAETLSQPILVTDSKRLSAQILGAGSNFTVEGSNDEGLQVAPVNWSTMTVIPAAGAYAIEPAMRWVRFGRPGSANTITVEMAAF